MVMEKELKGTIIEIVVLTIFLIIVVPICVEASSNYRKQKETISLVLLSISKRNMRI